jgi:3-oxoacyl-[acyl-carrier protein] reductase
VDRLKEKVVIVTGGARGLGKRFCLGLAEEGANVVVADILEEAARETSEEILTKGGHSIAIGMDVTTEPNTIRMAEETIEAFGRIDILVNNAALFYGITRKPFVEIPIEEWDRLMTVNLKGPFLCCRAVFPQMKRQGKGKIINLASETAFTGSPYFAHYVTSKGGVISFTRSLAAELGQYKICVNAVAPGLTDTEAARTIMDDISKYDVSRIPLKRLEQPDDLVGAVLFLASDESDFMTGQTLVVNGGRYMH